MTGRTRARAGLSIWIMVMLALMMATVPRRALAASGTMLSFDQTRISQVGKQARNSSACLGYAYAYADTMTTGTVHSWKEYDSNGGRKGEAGFYGKGMTSSYTYQTCSGSQKTLRALYDAISSGHPAIAWVTQRNGGQHWVTIVGYTSVSNPDSLSMGNFLMLDPVYGASSSPESLTKRGYTLKLGSNNVRVCKRSVGTTGSDTTSGRWGTTVADLTSARVKIRLADNTGRDRGTYPCHLSARVTGRDRGTYPCHLSARVTGARPPVTPYTWASTRDGGE